MRISKLDIIAAVLSHSRLRLQGLLTYAGASTWDQITVALAYPIDALHPDHSGAVTYGSAKHHAKD